MSEEKKDLTYFLKNPDEMPEDPKEIERLSNEHMAAALAGGTEMLNVDSIVGKQDEKKDGGPSDAKVEEAAKPEAKAEDKPAAAKAEEKVEPEAKAEAKPEGILAKDGKHVIPYSQLESARQRAVSAEAIVKEQAARIEALEAAKNPAEVATDVATLTEDELAALEADSPTLAKTLRAQQAAIQKLTDEVKSVTNRQAEQAAAEDAEVKTEVQTAIDANPTLAGWQTAEDQTMWNRASRFDKVLREDPEFANVAFADRFSKVVELTQAALGLEAPAAPKVEEQPPLKPEEVRAAAAAKLVEKSKATRPVSLSQIPGGAPPAVDEKQKVEQMSPTALGNQFLNMTRDQMDAYLASL